MLSCVTINDGAWMTEAARSTRHYSNSMFIIQVDWAAIAIFEAKWHREAELTCRSWTATGSSC
jgi:hypothetical protein